MNCVSRSYFFVNCAFHAAGVTSDGFSPSDSVGRTLLSAHFHNDMESLLLVWTKVRENAVLFSCMQCLHMNYVA